MLSRGCLLLVKRRPDNAVWRKELRLLTWRR